MADKLQQQFEQERLLNRNEMAILRRDVQDFQIKLNSLSNNISQSTKDMQENVARGLVSVTRGLEVVQENLQKEVDVRNGEIGKLSTRITETLNKAAAKLREELTALQIDISSLRSTKTPDVSAEIQQLKAAISKQERLPDVRAEIQQLRAAISKEERSPDVRAEIQQLRAAISKEELRNGGENAKIASSLQEFNSLRQDIARMEGVDDQLLECCQGLQARMSALHSEISENSRQLALLEKDGIGGRNHVQVQETDKADKAEQIRLRDMVNLLRNQYTGMREELSTLQEHSLQNQAHASNLGKPNAEFTRLELRIDKVYESLNRLCGQGLPSRGTVDATSVAQLTARVDTISDKCDNMNADIRSLRGSVHTKAEIANLRVHIMDGVSEQYAPIHGEISSLNGQSELSKARLSEIHAECRAFGFQEKALQARLNEVQSAHKMSEASARHENNLLRQHVSKLAGDLHDRVTRESTRIEICSAVDTLVEERISPLSEEMESVIADRREWSSRCQECQEECAEMREYMVRETLREAHSKDQVESYTNPLGPHLLGTSMIHVPGSPTSEALGWKEVQNWPTVVPSPSSESSSFLLRERERGSPVAAVEPPFGLPERGLTLEPLSDLPKAGETWAFSGRVASICIFSSSISIEKIQTISCYWNGGKLRRFDIVATARSGDTRVQVKNVQGLQLNEVWVPTHDPTGRCCIEKCDTTQESQSDCTFA